MSVTRTQTVEVCERGRGAPTDVPLCLSVVSRDPRSARVLIPARLYIYSSG